MNDLKISAIPPNMIDIVWDQCVPHLQRVVDKSHGEMTIESTYQKFATGGAQLIAISRGKDIIAVNSLELRIFDSGARALFIPITGGDGLDEWMPQFLEMAKEIAKSLKCTELRGLAVRPGWMKKLEPHGWENVHMVIKCNIED